jgi:hypothetical protein
MGGGGMRYLIPFWRALRKHRKRGNIRIPPLGFIKARRMAQAERMILRGPPYRKPRWWAT